MIRDDYVLLDDTLQIMVLPYKPHPPQWLTYDELDDMRLTHSPRLPRMLFEHNEIESWASGMINKLQRRGRSVEPNRDDS